MSALMQDSSLDDKIIKMWQLYADNTEVATSLRDVEAIRANAQNIGIMTSVAAFGLNEVARLTLRSPIFKLKVQNIAFFAIAPSIIAKYSYQQAICDRVDNLWRIHQNRERKGLGGTKNDYNLYNEDEHTGDRGFRINTGLHLSMNAIVTGEREQPMLSNSFTRFHKSIEEYPEEHDNMDDEKLFTTDNFERLKPLMPKKGTTVGTTSLLPVQDTDEKLFFFDTQGESLYTNPPDPNIPVIDHKLDEESIWSFRKSNFNQKVIYNPYTRDIWSAMKEHNAPWWGLKLGAPAFSKGAEQYAKFFEQYAIRLDFEKLKLKHAQELRPGDMAQRQRMKNEIDAFLTEAERKMTEIEMRDVYTTDHKPVAKKYSTLSEEEDLEYYNYQKSLQEYSKQPFKANRISQFESGRFEKGSLKQRIFEPLAGAKTLENGTVFYEVSEKEIQGQLGEDRLRAQFDRAKIAEAIEAEDEAEVRMAMFDQLQEAGYDVEEWDKILAREFNTFQEGEKYDYVTDLRRTFDAQVSTSLEDKIFKQIPAHHFWDIKKPQRAEKELYLNPYNPARKYPFQSFFDMRRHEEWLHSKEEQRNLNTNISQYNRV